MTAPRLPEQAYDVGRGHPARPGRPAATAYVPPVRTAQPYAQPPPYGQPPYGQAPYGQAYGSGPRREVPESGPAFSPGGRHERRPRDTYRPAYETAAVSRTVTAPPGSATVPAPPQIPGLVPAPVPAPVPTPVPAPAHTPAVPSPVPPPSSVSSPAAVRGPTGATPRPTGGRAAARRAERARRAAQRPEALRRLVPQALVVAFLASGTSAFVAHDKAVELTVDGSPRTLHTFADDVGELLDEQGLELDEHDSVGPSPQQALAHGDEVSVRYGRPVDLTLDGVPRRAWTTARTVESALRQFGVRTAGARISVTLSADIPRTGIAVDVRTQRRVTFLADGDERTVHTNVATVSEALAESGIELAGLDATSAPMDSFPHDGQTITVMRITGREKVEEERIPFRTVRRQDPRLTRGTQVVERAGRTGIRRVTYRLRTVDGVREKPRRIAVEVLRRPQKQIIRVGTSPLPSSVPGADHLDWAALAQCESGGRPAATDRSGRYGGLYQFDTRTWHGLGGSGRPQDAPAEEQTYRAKKLYVSQGASPWPFCGRKLTR